MVPTALLLLLTAALCSAPGCSRSQDALAHRDAGAPKQLQLVTVAEGLSAQHLAGPPVVERISCPPRSDCLTSRVYRDGTLYYLVETSDAAPPRWNRIATLTPAGVQSIERLYASLCGKQDPVLANDAGSDRHRVNVPGCVEEFVVTGIPAGPLAPIQQVTQLINSSVVPGSGG